MQALEEPDTFNLPLGATMDPMRSMEELRRQNKLLRLENQLLRARAVRRTTIASNNRHHDPTPVPGLINVLLCSFDLTEDAMDIDYVDLSLDSDDEVEILGELPSLTIQLDSPEVKFASAPLEARAIESPDSTSRENLRERGNHPTSSPEGAQQSPQLSAPQPKPATTSQVTLDLYDQTAVLEDEDAFEEDELEEDQLIETPTPTLPRSMIKQDDPPAFAPENLEPIASTSTPPLDIKPAIKVEDNSLSAPSNPAQVVATSSRLLDNTTVTKHEYHALPSPRNSPQKRATPPSGGGSHAPVGSEIKAEMQEPTTMGRPRLDVPKNEPKEEDAPVQLPTPVHTPTAPVASSSHSRIESSEHPPPVETSIHQIKKEVKKEPEIPRESPRRSLVKLEVNDKEKHVVKDEEDNRRPNRPARPNVRAAQDREPPQEPTFPGISIAARRGRPMPPTTNGTTHAADIVKKREGQPQEYILVQLIKAPNGEGLFDISQFGMERHVEVDERFKRGYSREVLGGEMYSTFQNWSGKRNVDPWADISINTIPFYAGNLKWNPSMPTRPGTHGICFVSFNVWDNSHPIHTDINFFTRLDTNNWLYAGVYNVKRFGQLDSAQMARLPCGTVDSWTKGVCTKTWGRSCVEEANEGLPEERRIVRDEEGVRRALGDGRLKLSFTVMQCVGYRTEVFDALLARCEGGPRSGVTRPSKDKKPTNRNKDNKGKGKAKAKAVNGGSKKRGTSSDSEDCRASVARKRRRTLDLADSGDDNLSVGPSSRQLDGEHACGSGLRRSTRVQPHGRVRYNNDSESDLTDMEE